MFDNQEARERPTGPGIDLASRRLSLSLFLSFSLSFSVSHWPAGEAGPAEAEGRSQAASYYFQDFEKYKPFDE